MTALFSFQFTVIITLLLSFFINIIESFTFVHVRPLIVCGRSSRSSAILYQPLPCFVAFHRPSGPTRAPHCACRCMASTGVSFFSIGFGSLCIDYLGSLDDLTLILSIIDIPTQASDAPQLAELSRKPNR